MERISTRDDIVSELEEGAAILGGEELDDAIIGVTTDGRAVYDYDLLVAIISETDKVSAEAAADYIDYNTIQSLPNMGALPPVIMTRLRFKQ